MSKRSNRESPPIDRGRIKTASSDHTQFAPDAVCCGEGPSGGLYATVAVETVATPVGDVPKVSTVLGLGDRLGAHGQAGVGEHDGTAADHRPAQERGGGTA